MITFNTDGSGYPPTYGPEAGTTPPPTFVHGSPSPASVSQESVSQSSSFNGRKALLIAGAVIAGTIALVASVAALVLFAPPVAVAIGVGGAALMGIQIGLGVTALIGVAAAVGLSILASKRPQYGPRTAANTPWNEIIQPKGAAPLY